MPAKTAIAALLYECAQSKGWGMCAVASRNDAEDLQSPCLMHISSVMVPSIGNRNSMKMGDGFQWLEKGDAHPSSNLGVIA